MICTNPILRGKERLVNNIIAETTCEAYAIKIDTFHNLLDSSKIFRDFIFKDLSEDKESIIGNLLRIRYKTKEEVLYDFLVDNIDQSESIDGCWYPQEVCYTQQELSEFIGVSRITITTLLKSFV